MYSRAFRKTGHLEHYLLPNGLQKFDEVFAWLGEASLL